MIRITLFVIGQFKILEISDIVVKGVARQTSCKGRRGRAAKKPKFFKNFF